MAQGTILALQILGGCIIFIAGMFVGIGIGYGMGYDASAEEEREFADPGAFWAKEGGKVPGTKTTLEEDLAEWRTAVARSERLRSGARR